jgi:hypothetical protein
VVESVGRALEAVAMRCGALRSINVKGDSWRYSISITNRPRSRFVWQEVISTGKGDRSVVGHFWFFFK